MKRINKYVVLMISVFLTIMSCDKVEKQYCEDGSITSISTVDKYTEYNESGSIVEEGIVKKGLFTGMKYSYSEEGDTLRSRLFINDTIHSYEEYLANKVKERWIVKVTQEEFFLDVNKDTLLLGELYKAKFIVNHRIADSIRIYAKENDSSTLIFKWPEDESTSFKYIIKTTVLGGQEFSGKISIRFNSTVDPKHANKLLEIPFETKYFVE